MWSYRCRRCGRRDPAARFASLRAADERARVRGPWRCAACGGLRFRLLLRLARPGWARGRLQV